VNRTADKTWRLVAMHDPAGRRGLWFKTRYDNRGNFYGIELCSGREGDDAYASFLRDQVPTHVGLMALIDVLSRAEMMCECYFEQRDAYRRDDPTLAAVLATMRERDEARALAFEAMEAGLQECERLRAKLRDAEEAAAAPRP